MPRLLTLHASALVKPMDQPPARHWLVDKPSALGDAATGVAAVLGLQPSRRGLLRQIALDPKPRVEATRTRLHPHDSHGHLGLTRRDGLACGALIEPPPLELGRIDHVGASRRSAAADASTARESGGRAGCRDPSWRRMRRSTSCAGCGTACRRRRPGYSRVGSQ